VIFSWHETGIQKTYLNWDMSVDVLSQEEFEKLSEN
jgi:hypothetical protein